MKELTSIQQSHVAAGNNIVRDLVAAGTSGALAGGGSGATFGFFGVTVHSTPSSSPNSRAII